MKKIVLLAIQILVVISLKGANPILRIGAITDNHFDFSICFTVFLMVLD